MRTKLSDTSNQDSDWLCIDDNGYTLSVWEAQYQNDRIIVNGNQTRYEVVVDIPGIAFAWRLKESPGQFKVHKPVWYIKRDFIE